VPEETLGSPAPLMPPAAPPAVTPMADNQPAGALVKAVVAPSTGPIPDHEIAVVVAVKEWFQSSTIWVSVVALLGLGVDSIVEGLLTTDGPVQWRPLLTRALIAIGFGYQAMRRKSDNSVIR